MKLLTAIVIIAHSITTPSIFCNAIKSQQNPAPTPAPTPEPLTLNPTQTPNPPPPVFQEVAPLHNQYDVCNDFCKGAITTCEGVVDWTTNTYATPFTRHIEGGAGTNATGKPWEQYDACHNTCMGWVYWKQSPVLDGTRFNNYDVIGDSLNCRHNHLKFASGVPNFPYGLQASESESAAQHCQHITPDGGWVCTDYRNGENKTPGQIYKENIFTRHRLGDCWLAADDKIADCHRKALTDANVKQNLLWLPDDVEYIFLQTNALTKVPDLYRFTALKGIYLEHNAIDMLEPNDFANNKNLEIINLSNNFIIDLPGDIFAPLAKLKALYFNFNYIKMLPSTTFSVNTEIEMIAVGDNQLTGFEEGTFDGLSSLKLLAFGQQGKHLNRGRIFGKDGIPDGLFDDLVSLEYLSTFINDIGILKNSMFGDWSAKLESIAIFLYAPPQAPKSNPPALIIEDGVFGKLPNLIDIAAYTSGNVISPDDMTSNTKIKTVLYGSQFSVLAPLPEPALYKADLVAPPPSP